MIIMLLIIQMLTTLMTTTMNKNQPQNFPTYFWFRNITWVCMGIWGIASSGWTVEICSCNASWTIQWAGPRAVYIRFSVGPYSCLDFRCYKRVNVRFVNVLITATFEVRSVLQPCIGQQFHNIYTVRRRLHAIMHRTQPVGALFRSVYSHTGDVCLIFLHCITIYAFFSKIDTKPNQNNTYNRTSLV